MNFVLYLLFLFFTWLFAILPFRVLYALSDVMFLLVYYLFGYRKKVVHENLASSFPEKSPDAIRRIEKAFYRHFCDILIEGIKAFSMTRRQVRKRYIVSNPELMEAFFRQKQSVIVVLGHYNNWEWGSVAAGIFFDHTSVGFYKELSNKYIDNYIKKVRARGGTILASITTTLRSFEQYRRDPAAFLMIADQSPLHAEQAIWLKFLQHETATLHGPEKYAVAYGMPVIYGAVSKIRRGYYRADLKVLCGDPKSTRRGEITEQYMTELELQIQEKPEYWLWSHRRWKHKRKH